MKISAKKREELYAAIHSEISDLRIALQLDPKTDYKLAQVELKIWRKQKEVLGIAVV